MALDFPASPTTGQTYTSAGVTWRFDGVKWVIVAVGGGASVTISDTAPASPQPGALWWDSVGGQMYIWYNDPNTSQWVPTTNLGSVPEAPNDGQLYGRNGQLAAWQPAAPASLAADNIGRNWLHNPYFNIWQRGAGPWTATGNYAADRWRLSLTNDAVSIAQLTHNDASRLQIGDESAVYALQATFTGSATSGSYSYLQQVIEGIRRLAGKTVIVSFWAACSVANTKLGFNILQLFGTGGSPSPIAWVQANGNVITLTSTGWTRYSSTITIPNLQGKTVGTNGDDGTQIGLFFSQSGTPVAGAIGVQSGVVQLWGMQLEVGTAPTPLEKINPRQDLQNCMRFYWTGRAYAAGVGGNGGNVSVSMSLINPVTMRASPTVTVTANNDTQVTTPSQSPLGTTAIAFSGACSLAGWILDRNFTASADL